MKKLLPILLLIIGLGAGGGVGWFLQPHAEAAAPAADAAAGSGNEDDSHATETELWAAATTGHYAPPPTDTETVRLPNQFVVPLISEGRVRALVVIGLALEFELGHTFSMPDHEPRLRAVFLQLLFDHANLGGFDGVFTSGEALLALRRTLREAARTELGPKLYDVLITALVRQDS